MNFHISLVVFSAGKHRLKNSRHGKMVIDKEWLLCQIRFKEPLSGRAWNSSHILSPSFIPVRLFQWTSCRWTSLPQKTAAFNEGENSCIGEGYPLTLAWHGSDTDTQSGSSFLSVFRLRSRLAPSPWFMVGWTFTPWLSLTVGPGHSSWPPCNEWTC